MELKVVGKSVPRVDSLAKVTGKANYSVDLRLPRMLYAKVLRSPYPHARIININTSKAERLAQVRAIVTGKDCPEERLGIIRDRYIMARDVVRFSGEGVAAVAAESVGAAEEALDLIEVEYEPLPAVFDPEEAIKPQPPAVVHPDLFKYAVAPQPTPIYNFEPDLPNVYVHRQIRRGDVEKGFQEADFIIENRFSLPRVQHSCLELHNAIAQPEPDGGLTVWEPTHVLYSHKTDLCRLFHLPPSKVRVISLYIGGCFGGRVVITPAMIATLLALKASRPVKLVLSRDEVFVECNSREAMVIYVKDSVRADGTLLARELRFILNAGAYCGNTIAVARNCVFGAIGTYRLPNLKIDSYAVATNEPPTGAFRGFGAPEVTWALESQMDMIARKLGIDPVEIRRKNILREGEEDACGTVTHSIGARECLDSVAEWIECGEPSPVENGSWKRGKGIALGNKYTVPATASVVTVKVNSDATIEVRHSAHEVGQGCNTLLAQIAAEEFGTSVDRIRQVYTDTDITPFDSGTVSSRTTFHTGNALRLACQNAKTRLFELASEKLGVPVVDLNIEDGIIRGRDKTLKIAELFSSQGYLIKGGELLASGIFIGPLEDEDAKTGQGKRVVTSYAHGAAVVEVAVNIETGEVKILRVGQSWDMGRPINPKMCEGQIDGGTGMGIGTALYEAMVLDNGAVVNPNFMDYKLPSSLDVPVGDDVASMIAAAPHREGPFGAKGFSEGGIVAIAPAIANAIYEATGVRIKDLPITKEKVLKGLGILAKQQDETGVTP